MRGDALVARVLEKCEAYQLSRLWLGAPYVRPEAWLSNFAPEEREVAAILLDRFLYYSDTTTDALLRSTYLALRDEVYLASSSSKLAGLGDLRETAVFTGVEGEMPSPTDSGNLFCRKARDVLGISEAALLTPARALEEALAGKIVVFLDDFLGSGNQMRETWQRPYRTDPPHSFADLHSRKSNHAIYLTLVATHIGLANIDLECPQLVVRAAHILGEEYNVRNLARLPDLRGFSGLDDRVHALLTKYGPRLKLHPHMRKADFPVYGWRSLGLLLAFQHGVPDATLPIIWAEGPDDSWTPLVHHPTSTALVTP